MAINSKMKLLTFIVLFACVGLSVFLLSKTTQAQSFYAPQGIALEGYDPVSYFSQNKATKGKASLATQHAGVTFHFSSEDNLKAFKSNASKYLPQYGGFDAYAMANGSRFKSKPSVFSVVSGKLYLYASEAVKKTWGKDSSSNIQKANQNWK